MELHPWRVKSKHGPTPQGLRATSFLLLLLLLSSCLIPASCSPPSLLLCTPPGLPNSWETLCCSLSLSLSLVPGIVSQESTEEEGRVSPDFISPVLRPLAHCNQSKGVTEPNWLHLHVHLPCLPLSVVFSCLLLKQGPVALLFTQKIMRGTEKCYTN